VMASSFRLARSRIRFRPRRRLPPAVEVPVATRADVTYR